MAEVSCYSFGFKLRILDGSFRVGVFEFCKLVSKVGSRPCWSSVFFLEGEPVRDPYLDCLLLSGP